MSRRKRTNFSESAWENDATYLHYLNHLTELSTSMFDWKNLPDSVDARFIEIGLFTNGQMVFFKDDVLGFLCLDVMANGDWNVYRVPKNRRAYAVNGYQLSLTDENSVIIYNNYIRSNSILDAKMYAKRLYDLDRTIDVNARAQKTPVLLQGSETQRLTLLNLYKEFDGNSPVIFGDKNLDLNGIKVVSTNAPYVCDKLYQLKTQYWNEALTMLGISNMNVQKKERLVSDEAVRSQGGVIASRYSRLEARREAVEQINAMFGLNIEVNYRADYREADDETMFLGETGSTGENVEGQDMVIDLRTK